MIHWVIDASALVDVLVAAAPQWWLRDAVRSGKCAAPASIDHDAAALLSRLVGTGALPDVEALQVLHDVRAAPLQRLDTGPLLGRMWSLRHEAGLQGAAYLRLAEALDVTLMTSDGRLESVPGHRARVHMVSGQG